MTATITQPHAEPATMPENGCGDKLARDCTLCENGTLQTILGTLMGCIDSGAYFYVSEGITIEVTDAVTIEMIRRVG